MDELLLKMIGPYGWDQPSIHLHLCYLLGVHFLWFKLGDSWEAIYICRGPSDSRLQRQKCH